MKRKTAKEILAESFRELAENKPVDKITVPEITENCGIALTATAAQFVISASAVVALWISSSSVSGSLPENIPSSLARSASLSPPPCIH